VQAKDGKVDVVDNEVRLAAHTRPSRGIPTGGPAAYNPTTVRVRARRAPRHVGVADNVRNARGEQRMHRRTAAPLC
jgi:hypothetical protein